MQNKEKSIWNKDSEKKTAQQKFIYRPIWYMSIKENNQIHKNKIKRCPAGFPDEKTVMKVLCA